MSGIERFKQLNDRIIANFITLQRNIEETQRLLIETYTLAKFITPTVVKELHGKVEDLERRINEKYPKFLNPPFTLPSASNNIPPIASSDSTTNPTEFVNTYKSFVLPSVSK